MNPPEKTTGVLSIHHQTSSRTGKAGFVLCAALLAALTGCTTYVEHPRAVVYEEPQPVLLPPPVTTVEVVIRSEEDFYQPLSPYGRWEVVGSYGRCWIPARVEANWRPYCNGRWERTDAGWYWVSDEPWAWATYHYGRWDFSAGQGWYWVPRTQWAPAWVSWHHGGGYVSWAPLHPSARIGVGGNVEVDARVVAPRAYVVVEERKFLQPIRPTTVVVNNTTIINQTVNITNVKVVNNTVINEGPQTQIIEKASGRKVHAVPARELRHRTEAEVVTKERISPTLVERKVEAPARTEVGPPERKASLDAERRANEAKKAEADAQRNAREAEKKAQAEAERRAKDAERRAQTEQRNARELERNAQLDAERRANEAKKAQADAERRAKERQAQVESQRSAQELERKATLEAERRANDTKKAEADARRNAQDAEKKTQADAERRAKDAERQAQAEAQRNAQELERKARLDSDRRASEAKKAEADAKRNAKALEKKEADSEQRAKGKQTQRPSAPGAKGKQDAKEQDGTNTVESVQKGKGKAD